LKVVEANKRAIEDYSQYSQYVRASAQFAFAANGGAALAMLSFLTAIATAKTSTGAFRFQRSRLPLPTQPAFIWRDSSMYVMAYSTQYWGHRWEDAALTGKPDFSGPYAQRANAMTKAGFLLLIASAIAFIPGSFFVVRGFLP
jgi:hypothetical protein